VRQIREGRRKAGRVKLQAWMKVRILGVIAAGTTNGDADQTALAPAKSSQASPVMSPSTPKRGTLRSSVLRLQQSQQLDGRREMARKRREPLEELVNGGIRRDSAVDMAHCRLQGASGAQPCPSP
jgi:hypothetical protein